MHNTQAKRLLARGQGLLALAAMAAMASACGGGSGADPAAAQLGVAKVVVLDAFGAPVPGASVALAAASGTVGTTDANGLVFLSSPPGAVELSISVPTFKPVRAQATVGKDAVTTVPVVLQRATAPAGGALATRSGLQPQQSADGRTLSFEVELVVVDADAQPVLGLTAADFQLLACQPDAATPTADCLRNAPADHGHLATDTASSLALVAAQPTVAHAVGLLIDQSGSIADSDPLNTRLYAAKFMLSQLAAGDQAVVGAFADGLGARLPQQPLSLLGTVADKAAAPTLFAPLQALAGQSGGRTPLYAAIDAMRAQLTAAAAQQAGLARAMVVFTDGADSYCGGAAGCSQRRQQAVDAAHADGLRLFTIGLGGNIDVEALSQLATGGGGAMLYADTVEQLIPLYGSLDRLMSLGLPTYRLRFSIDTGEAGVFASGQTVLARARVLVQGQVVHIPLAVSLP
jgi:hypothetical protein